MLLRKSMCIGAAWLCLLGVGQLTSAQAAGFSAGSSADADNDPWAKFDDRPLFPEPLFPDDDMKTDDMRSELDNDIKQMQAPAKKVSIDSGASSSNAISNSAVDDEMRRQMRSVAHWLYRYCLRNGSRFPGPGTSNDIMWAAQTQLTELVPNNPYNYGPTQNMNWGIPATFNPNGSFAAGSPVWNDQYQEGLAANQYNRVQLQLDYGLNPTMAVQDASTPPQDWSAAPGTITAVGNNQGFFIVWGADKNGKPIRNPVNGKTYIITVSTSGTVNDTASPNET
ncbi:MAG TPA: hypothetical protein V6D22_21105 [Candidatus Obscuribacterales bacterium]